MDFNCKIFLFSLFLFPFLFWNSKINQKTIKVDNVTTIFGNGSTPYPSIDGPVSIATINQPQGISIHPITQEVYIAENGGQNIRGWNRTSQTVRTVVSLGLNLYPLYLDFLNDGTFFITTGNRLYELFTNGLFVFSEIKNLKERL